MAKNLLCIRRCWHKGTIFNPGDLVKRETVEYEEEGKMVTPRHFEAIADPDPETIAETLEVAGERDILEKKKAAMNFAKKAKPEKTA